MTSLDGALRAIEPLDEAAMAAAREGLDRLTKPPGSLGRLEELAIWLAGVTGDSAPAVRSPAAVVVAADHGVAMAHPVSAWPSDVTAQMVARFLAGGAAISVLAARAGAHVNVVDAGVAGPIPARGSPGPAASFVRAPVRAGTADMTVGPAMSRADALAAIESGLRVVADLVAAGVDVVAVGEMGIGNTTAASALVAALTGLPAAGVTGPGTGLDAAGVARKVRLIERALEVNAPDPADSVGVLAAVGGFEIATLVGVIVGAAAARLPCVLDGFITGAAALVAASLDGRVAPRLVAAHRSTEPGHAVVLDRLGLRPLLDLDLRLGEGTGAALALLLVDAAVRIRDGMATFDTAGVAARRDPA